LSLNIVFQVFTSLLLRSLDYVFPCSNIPEFSKYIQKLPSLDKMQVKKPTPKTHTASTSEESKFKSVGLNTRSNPEDVDSV